MKKLLLVVHPGLAHLRFWDHDTIKAIEDPSWLDDYSRVVVLTDEELCGETVSTIEAAATDTIQWGWGYDPECFTEDCDKEDAEWLIRSLGHEFTWIPPELRDFRFKDYAVSICGGADAECLEDMRAILRHLEIAWTVEERFIYHSTERYLIDPDSLWHLEYERDNPSDDCEE